MPAARDQVLLFHAMRLAASVDGRVSGEELAVIRSVLATLPDFAGADLEGHVQASTALAEQFGGLLESVEALMELSSPALKARAYLLAVEVTCVSEGLNSAERALVQMLQKVLQVDEALARRVHEVMGLKYGV